MKSLAGVKRRTVKVIRVFRSGLDGRRGRVRAGNLDLPCALGAAGIVRAKREGDGGTPAGRLRPLGAYFRSDRMSRPRLAIGLVALSPLSGWCDDPASRQYNRPVRLPFIPSHERLWREDALYDLVVDLSWNRRPAVSGRGSAIFLHAARPGFAPTEGCVAVARDRIARLVERIGPRTLVAIG